jgi:hypothetical protein
MGISSALNFVEGLSLEVVVLLGTAGEDKGYPNAIRVSWQSMAVKCVAFTTVSLLQSHQNPNKGLAADC